MLLCVISLALPWGIFQRTPLMGLTLVKLSGALLIALALLRLVAGRSRVLWRTQLEAVVAVFLVLCLLSSLVSLDRASSLAQVWVYFTYLGFFFAIVSVVDSVAFARRLLLGFVFSATFVCLLCALCSAGLLTPTHTAATAYADQRVVPGVFSQGPLRLVTASDDFNEGVFLPLMAFAACLFLVRDSGLDRRLKRATLFAIPVLGTAMVIALSRSSLVVAGILVLIVLRESPRWRFHRRHVVLVLAMLLLIGWLGMPYLKAIVGRVSDFESVQGSSDAGRLLGFVAALGLLPEYWLMGAGLNASDVALASSPYGERLGGLTLHNVPFKMLLDLGVFGLLGYLWFYWRVVRATHCHLMGSSNETTRALGTTFMAMTFSAFWITNINPFTSLSFYPFALGIAFGLIARIKEDALKPSPASFSRLDLVVATAVVAAVVSTNAVAYEVTAHRVDEFAGNLEQGTQLLRSGDEAGAEEAYSTALAEAVTGPPRPGSRPSLQNLPYFTNAARVYQLAHVYGQMNLGLATSQVNPTGAAAYGLGKALVGQRRHAEALAEFEYSVGFMPEFARGRHDWAECLWAVGDVIPALASYEHAAILARRNSNQAYRVRVDETLRRKDRLLAEDPPTVQAHLEAVWILRGQGKWAEAVALCRDILEWAPQTPDAHFHLGVDAQLRGNTQEALERYRTAVGQRPDHPRYQTCLEALLQAAPPQTSD